MALRRSPPTVRAAAFACLLGLVGIGLPAAPAGAATLDAACAGTVGSTASLVDAIMKANELAGPDTVRLGAGCRYQLLTPHNFWYGPNGLPAIAGDTTIEGNGAT